MDRAKLWTRDYTIDALTNFLVYFSHYLIIVVISLYAMEGFDATAVEAGIIYGIYIIGGLIARLLTGRFIDRLGRKRTLFFGLFLFIGATLCYFPAHGMLALIVVRLIHGFGWGIAATATGIIVAHLIPVQRLGEGTGYYALSVTLASAVGPLLGMVAMTSWGFTGVLVASSVLAFAAIVIVLFLRVPEVDVASTRRDSVSKRPRLSEFFEKSALPISIVSMFAGIGIASIFGFITPYVQSIDLVTAGEFFFVVYAIAMVLTRPITGALFDRRGENFVMYPALALFSLGLVVLGMTRDAVTLFVSSAVLGVGYGTFVSSAQALAIKYAPEGRVGLATSTFFALLDFGSGIAPSFLGLLVPIAGYRGVYLVSAAIVFACIPLYRLVCGRRRGRP